jgi:hypothetical protein
MARSLAGQILALRAHSGDEIATLTGYYGVGVGCTWTGEYRAAATALEQSIAMAERLSQSGRGPMLRVVNGALVSGRMNLSFSLWMLGYPEQALRQIDRLHTLPEGLRAQFDVAVIFEADLVVRCLFLRHYRGAHEKAQALIAVARENGFSYWETIGPVFLGQVMVQEGSTEEGIKAILEGREIFRATGEMMSFHYCNQILADLYLTARRPAEGLLAVHEAIAGADQLQIRFAEAELHRIKGELLLLAGAPESEAEGSMRRAIAIAQRQEAKGWELRAATSLARLLRRQGRIAEAREALAPVYNWFTEGFDTADLKDARLLLEELSAH